MSRRWVVDVWDDDDPAVRRLRDALELQPPAEPAPGATEAAEPVTAASETRRERVAALLARVKAGDRTAAAILRDLIDRRPT